MSQQEEADSIGEFETTTNCENTAKESRKPPRRNISLDKTVMAMIHRHIGGNVQRAFCENSYFSKLFQLERNSPALSDGEIPLPPSSPPPSPPPAPPPPSADTKVRRKRIVWDEPSDGKRSRRPEKAIERIDDEERFTFFFTKKYPFSNHYPCRFEIDGKEFNCTEQYYMYMKAMHFGDRATADAIMKSTDPKEMKTLGRTICGFDEVEWDVEHAGRRYMKEANMAKYKQNADLRDRLFETEGTTLVETNPTDSRWGIGLSMDSPLKLSRSAWRGKNWLGEILTEIREELMTRRKR